MWTELPKEQKDEYKRMILAFASLTELFAQKSEEVSDDKKIIPAPIINSKFQETIFQKSFHAVAEDIGNTSYDVSLLLNNNGQKSKYLIGIKTFGINSGLQKVAQFKANIKDWGTYLSQIQTNAEGIEDTNVINSKNQSLYKELARNIANIRNKRINSSIANLQGFKISDDEKNVYSVYHVLMPSKKGDSPKIYVGETTYNKIDVDNISVTGCTNCKNPSNFEFTDGKHRYRYTSADSQLLMDFKNNDIVQEEWDVIYAENAYEFFSDLAEKIYGLKKEIPQDNAENVEGYLLSKLKETSENIESYSWKITNKNDEVELFSGFNAFYGVGSKLSREKREQMVRNIYYQYQDIIDQKQLDDIIEAVKIFLTNQVADREERIKKANCRKMIMELAEFTGNQAFVSDISKLLFRPQDELYIPLPNSLKFHKDHPYFFSKNLCTIKEDDTGKTIYEANPDKQQRAFNLIFEPSGASIRTFITQDNGKAIESIDTQSYLGEWILRGIFQLEKYEPLTAQKLREVNINGIRLWKHRNKNGDVHIQFIWIDDWNLPKDYIKR